MMESSLDIWLRKIHGTPCAGWFAPEEGEACVQEILSLPFRRPRIVEIGSYAGRSTRYLALGAFLTQGRVTAIDHCRGSAEHQPLRLDLRAEVDRNLRAVGLRGVVSFFPGEAAIALSRWPLDRAVHFLLVDGAHEEEAVRADLQGWGPRIATEGIIAMHDSTFDGVRAAALSFFDSSWDPFCRAEGLAFYRRRSWQSRIG